MDWTEITKKIQEAEDKIRLNEEERRKLQEEYEVVRGQVGCDHHCRLHYIVADRLPRYGCYECDRILAEKIRSER